MPLRRSGYPDLTPESMTAHGLPGQWITSLTFRVNGNIIPPEHCYGSVDHRMGNAVDMTCNVLSTLSCTEAADSTGSGTLEDDSEQGKLLELSQLTIRILGGIPTEFSMCEGPEK